jgi:hypothetical protein
MIKPLLILTLLTSFVAAAPKLPPVILQIPTCANPTGMNTLRSATDNWIKLATSQDLPKLVSPPPAGNKTVTCGMARSYYSKAVKHLKESGKNFTAAAKLSEHQLRLICNSKRQEEASFLSGAFPSVAEKYQNLWAAFQGVEMWKQAVQMECGGDKLTEATTRRKRLSEELGLWGGGGGLVGPRAPRGGWNEL